MIKSVHDIKPDLRFRSESTQFVPEKKKGDGKQQSFRDSSDSLNVAEEVKVLSRMGMLWGESVIEVDDSGFHFTLVFYNHENERVTIVARKNTGGENCGVSWWFESDEQRLDAALVVGIHQADDNPQTESAFKTDIISEIKNFESEKASSVCDTIFYASYLLWRVMLNKSQATAIRANYFPFVHYKTAYSIICTQSHGQNQD